MAKLATSTTGKKAGSGKRPKQYRRPLTGEKRKRRLPLWIDRLPKEVRDEILAARGEGKTWKETARAASEKAGRSIPVSTVQRWYDLRIEQPRREVPELGELLNAVIELTCLLETEIKRRAMR